MFKVGDRVAHPLHGAGTISEIERKKIDNSFKDYYVMRIPKGDMRVMVPVDACDVVGLRPIIDSARAEEILSRAQAASVHTGIAECDCFSRILVKGNAVVTEEAAKAFADHGILLFGNESQTVGPEDAPMSVHLIMLDSEIVLLEGIRLSAVEEGVYFLNAAPVNLGGSDGAPCRAWLMSVMNREHSCPPAILGPHPGETG